MIGHLVMFFRCVGRLREGSIGDKFMEISRTSVSSLIC
jgi:hypothetical protein